MSRENNPIDAAHAGALVARFLHAAKLCRARDLKQLSILTDLVRGISETIHALQKERGASSIFLGSDGTQFAAQLLARVSESLELETRLREHLDRVDRQLDPMSCSARFYTRVAFAFRALDSLTTSRAQVASLSLAPQDAVKQFTDVIALLLAVGFEAADIAVDPETSRCLIALVNFAQGKEYAGQERATAGAALSRGQWDDSVRLQLQQLRTAQDRSFKIFADFSDPRHLNLFTELDGGAQTTAFRQMRANAVGISADAWYNESTRRIDSMRTVEECIAADLEQLCAAKLAQAKAGSKRSDAVEAQASSATASFAMLLTEEGTVPLFGLEAGQPKPMRSILEVVEAQSRRIDDMNSQLESARTELAERKTIERAKGILMRSRRLSEKDAYTLMRQTAMSQNKRIFDIAEAIVGMADIFRA
jgi:Nitrate and nitrite sensing/ANTAR domain